VQFFKPVDRIPGAASQGALSALIAAAPASGLEPDRRTEARQRRSESPLLSSSVPSMRRPAIEVADVVRAKGRQFLERYRFIVSYKQAEGISGHEALPHCCPWRASG